eukprot:scaffold26954_cov50-Phaeocystis_antarctica.AAC.1
MPHWSFSKATTGTGATATRAMISRRVGTRRPPLGAARVSLLCEASLAVQGRWMATACRAGMKEPAEKTSWSCAELLELRLP